MNHARTVVAAALFALVGVASAAGPVGAWTGRFLPKVPVLPAGAPAAMKRKLATDLAMIKSGRLHLVLKADHTYTMHIVGLPMFGTRDTTGTWSQTGTKVSTLETGFKKPRVMDLDPAGKRMSLILGRSGSLVVFVR